MLRGSTWDNMARPSNTAAIDYTAALDLTHGLLERAACPADLPFFLVPDADKKGLRLRVTKAGCKSWQFETRIKCKLFTVRWVAGLPCQLTKPKKKRTACVGWLRKPQTRKS